jgi:hypothetical protein
MRNMTARITKTAPILATALLCSASFAQDQVATPQPVKGTPSFQRGHSNGGIAGTVLYANTTETGSRYNPAASTAGPEVVRTLDDIPIPLANIGGATTIDVTKVTYGIRRLANAPATTITAYWSTVTTEATAPDTQLDVPTTLIGTAALPANGTAAVTELVSFGDGTSTLFTVDLNDTIIAGGFGTFATGVSIDPPNALNPNNGWRITNGPDANVDAFWRHDPNDDSEAFLWFGGAPANPPGTFYIIVEGAAAAGDPCQEPLPFCNGDVAPIGGDGLVNVDDLLAVINTWGQTGPPRPQGDAAPLPNGNCLVNVDDLLAVINQWGACDIPTGACCLPNGSCLSAQTAEQCATAGGAYQGNGTDCGGVTCPVLPPNDECSGALAVEDGVNDVSNLNATTSQGIPGGECAFNGAGNFTRDVWFSYTTTSGGVLSVDVCGTTGAVTDTVMSIFSGDCGSLKELACDDDSCAAPSPELLSSATATVPGPGTYLIRVGSWANGPTGPLALNVAFQPADNDVCTFATPLSVPGGTTGSLTGSTVDETTACDGVLPGFGRWYTVTGNGNTLTASTCVPCTPGVNCPTWNARLHVYCGTICSSLFCVAGSDANACSFFQETVSWCSAPGQTYWILVSNPDGPTGDYTLNVTSGGACGTPLPCGLPNDECDAALTVTDGVNNIDGTGATTSNGIPGGLCTGAAANFTNDSWYKYTPTFTGFTEFSLCDSTPPVDDVLAVLNGTCAALVEIGCDDDGCTAGTFAIPSKVSVQTTAGDEVFVRVGTWNNTFPGGPRVLTITPGIGGCGPCVGTPEGLPCRVDGDVATADPNGGCNSVPPQFSPAVPVGTTICGIGSYYTNSGGTGSRDTDWYIFQPAVSGDYVLTGCASFGFQVGFLEDAASGDATSCVGLTFVGGGAIIPANTEGSITRTLVGGNTYIIFAAPQQGLGTLACPPAGETNYRFTVTGP